MGRRELHYMEPKKLTFKPKEGGPFILMFNKGKFTKETVEVLEEIGKLRSNDQAKEEANGSSTETTKGLNQRKNRNGLVKKEPKNKNISYSQCDFDSGSTNIFENGLNQEKETGENILLEEYFTTKTNDDYICDGFGCDGFGYDGFGYDDFGLYDNWHTENGIFD